MTVRLKEKREGTASVELNRVPLELKTGKMFRKQGTIEHRAQVSCMQNYLQYILRISIM